MVLGTEEYMKYNIQYLSIGRERWYGNRRVYEVYNTSLRGRFAAIFQINCKHVLFLYIVKQNKNNSRIFTKKFVDFQNLKKFNEDRILMETSI